MNTTIKKRMSIDVDTNVRYHIPKAADVTEAASKTATVTRIQTFFVKWKIPKSAAIIKRMLKMKEHIPAASLNQNPANGYSLLINAISNLPLKIVANKNGILIPI